MRLFLGHPVDISKSSSSNGYLFSQDLVLLNNRGVRFIDTFLPQTTKKFVRISEKFEITNFELSDGFC